MDPDGRDGDLPPNTEVWTASETLKLKGFDIRLGEAGMTMMRGNAIVTFSNGKEKFTQEYNVLITYSEGVSFSIGGSVTKTLYTREFAVDTPKESILRTFEGIFVSAGAGFSPPQLSKGPIGVSRTGAYTFTVDYITKKYDPKGWKGPTGGAGLGLSQLKVSLGLLVAAYKLPSSEWNPDYFYNMVFEERLGK